jgi:predicted nuclease of predicted toxin-antitoxin system
LTATVLHFLVDEDMPRSTAVALRQAGYVAVDVRDVGLAGQSDRGIMAYACAHGCCVATADLDFVNLARERPANYAGLILVRVPNALPTQQLNAVLLQALSHLSGAALHDLLVVIGVGWIRIRQLADLAK